MQADRVATCVRQVRGGHEQVEQTTSDLRSWWSCQRGSLNPPFEELGRRILDLRDLLRSHFHDEESADHDLGVDDLPKPANRRMVLLADLDQLVMRLRACHPGMDCWADAEHAIDRFLAKLESHETQEIADLPFTD